MINNIFYKILLSTLIIVAFLFFLCKIIFLKIPLIIYIIFFILTYLILLLIELSFPQIKIIVN